MGSTALSRALLCRRIVPHVQWQRWQSAPAGGWERGHHPPKGMTGSEDPPKVLAGSEDSPKVLAGSEDPPKVLAGSEDPPKVLAGSEDPPKVLVGSEDPPKVLAGSEDPPKVLAGSEDPPKVLAGSEYPPKVLAGSEDISKLLEGSEDITKALEMSEVDLTPARRSPTNSTVLLFPGQGSQQVGMARALLNYPNVRTMFDAAHKVLGYDLLELCLHGPEEVLSRTVHCQPAVFVTSLAATEKLSHEDPTAIDNCVAVAGFSVGEFAALVFSGALDFTEALYAVKARAEAMQRASDAVPSGMLSVIGRPHSKYNVACAEAREHCKSIGLENVVCDVANYLFPDGRVIAGNIEALQYLQRNSRKYHFLRTKMLPVSGAFHTPLMAPAMEPLQKALKNLEFKQPYVPVYCNIDGKRYKHASVISKLLVKQLVSPVKWEQTMHAIYERKKGVDFPRTLEMGPGRQLGSILKSCNFKAWKYYQNVDVFEKEESPET
ncbi:malonyl- -acyl carrier transacylase, mitochondrial [Pelobates cultripes]|uniref:Malonyl-CoA-acyl carrier protein transacylase, mitochondrial n=1 Tax=Pelobates cultripes TaxID=61616 RepID=A0AAD1W306_PELCU|nr:malonyl- -acyl carrier transacylase, mitochondrial [Pelobates cultripes]